MPRHINLGRRNPHCTATYHGTRTAYRYGCRCDHAREAERLARKRTREGRHTSPMVDGTGTRRRLQALAAIGWTFTEIGQRLGMLPANVRSLVADGRSIRHRDTADKVAALYRELSAIPGPSTITRRRAARNGWLSPAYWDRIDDPTEQPAALLVTAGETPSQRRARHADRYTLFLTLRAAGHGRGVIRRQLNINNNIYNQLAARAADTDQYAEAA